MTGAAVDAPRSSRTPRVTVLLAVHNGARFVGDAVESILAQTFTDFELLVVDDASTDASGAIVASFDDPRIRIVRNDINLGLTRSLNRGLAYARGALIARQDADDLSEPERLAKQVAYLNAEGDVALVGTWYRKIDEAGKSLGNRQLPTGDARIAWALLFYCPFVHSSVTFRRPIVLDEQHGYDERFAYAQDYELWSRLARCHRVANVPEYLVSYRVTTTSMTATIGDASGEGPRIAVENMRALAETSGSIEAPGVAQHTAMYQALYGIPDAMSSRDLTAAFERIIQVLDVFCAQSTFGSDARAAVRAEVRARVQQRLVAHVDRFTAGDFARVRALVGAPRWARLLALARSRQPR
jgi:hypothetical protein